LTLGVKAFYNLGRLPQLAEPTTDREPKASDDGWNVLLVTPGRELNAVYGLRIIYKYIRAYLPTYTESPRYAGRKSYPNDRLIKPLFSQYLFVDQAHTYDAIRSPLSAIREVLRFDSRPVVIDSETMQQIRTLAENPQVRAEREWHVGDQVVVEVGGREVHGRLMLDPHRKYRLVVGFEMFNRGVSIPFDPERAQVA
jgi:hypothetical protein